MHAAVLSTDVAAAAPETLTAGAPIETRFWSLCLCFRSSSSLAAGMMVVSGSVLEAAEAEEAVEAVELVLFSLTGGPMPSEAFLAPRKSELRRFNGILVIKGNKQIS